MMHFRTFLGAFILLTGTAAFAQNKPYFQQDVAYTIQVELNDADHTLRGNLSVEYTNNSPDLLDSIYMHLWPNAYKNGNTALAKQMMRNGDLSLYYANDDERGYIDQLDWKVNGQAVKWNYDADHIDIGVLHLNTPLNPGETITISTPFFVKVPSGRFSRLGHIGQSYQITQWYPKPAVYDREGWHPLPYLNQGEFFSEFGTFDVSITLPSNYVLGATGDIQDNLEEIEWLNQRAEATARIDSFDAKDMRFPESSKEMKTIRYFQQDVHDFAWFADKRYHVLKGEVQLPHSPKKVTTWAMFTNKEAHLWKNAIEYLNDATYYYSLWTGEYPYKHVTAVDGTISAGGGMEYPNITVIGSSGSARSLETVIMHEVGHNWFYGILGSNERVHPWLDEGLNSYTENRYLETKYPNEIMLPKQLAESFGLDWIDHQGLFYLGYILNARRSYDQPIEMHSDHYTSTNYGAIVYGKTALAFTYLLDYLGPELFDSAMRQYFNEWKFKHPGPDDVQRVFERVTQKDLSWFFNDMIKTTKKLDYSIAGVKKDKDGESYIKIVNNGEIHGPFALAELNESNEVIRINYYEADDLRIPFDPLAATTTLRIDPYLEMPESDRTNNTYRLNGLFKKYEKPKLQFLGGVENPDRSTLYWAPAIGFNENNHMMLGLAFYNSIIPQKKFEFTSVPMYSFATQTLTGYHELAYNIFPKNRDFMRNIRLSGAYSSFHSLDSRLLERRWDRIAPKVVFDFGKKQLNDPRNHQITLRSVYTIEHDNFKNEQEPFSNPGSLDSMVTRENLYNQLQYTFRHKLALNPYTFTLDLEQHKAFFKGSATFDIHFNYDEEGHGIDVRLFGGKFFTNDLSTSVNTPSPSRYNWQMDGQAGLEDYTYTAVMADRSQIGNVFNRQFINNHGAFKVPAARGTSGDWIGAINLKTWIPYLPFGAFADAGWNPIGTVDVATGEVTTETQLLWDAGVHFSLIKNQIEIYVPLIMSENLQSDLDFADIGFMDRIRFTFNLHNLNPLEQIRKINP